MDRLEKRLLLGNPMPFSGLHQKPEEPKEPERVVKVRYLAQGIVTIPEDKLPPNWAEMTWREKWDHINEVWFDIPGDDLLKGVEDCDFGETFPGLLEERVGDQDYVIVARTNEFKTWWLLECATQVVDEHQEGEFDG